MDEEKLPCELIEETLFRVPPKSLVRFRTVSKQWNSLFDDKTFINNHKMTYRFILATKSKFYSVSITPKIQVRELTLDIPYLESHTPKKLVDCNGFLLCGMDKGAVVWNPWLGHTRWIEPNQPSLYFNGVGYEYGNRRLLESGYKTLVSYQKESDPTKTIWQIHDISSNELKDIVLESGGGSSSSSTTKEENNANIHGESVSLNGMLYWVASYQKNNSTLFLISFNFSKERFYKFSDLSCGENHHCDVLVLKVFKGDRFSLLKQYHLTKKIEIWVTKNKIIENRCCGDVEWMNFMEVSTPNLPDLVRPSYYIENKRLVVCSCDKTGQAWIYVMGDKKLITKVQIDSMVDPSPLHCTYFPSLVSVPRGQKEAALQV